MSQTYTVATKDIDLLLQPAVAAVATATSLGQQLVDDGWEPQFPEGQRPGTESTADNDLPALRLAPAGGREGWFIELLAVPPDDQTSRKRFTRFVTESGHFGLPSFRYMPVAVTDAEESEFGLRIARPPFMALAHLLEHAEPDRTPVSSLSGRPRFVKDVGRAIALWWLAGRESVVVDQEWSQAWNRLLAPTGPHDGADLKGGAAKGLASVSDYLREAHELAVSSVLAPHGTTLPAYRRAYDGLLAFTERW